MNGATERRHAPRRGPEGPRNRPTGAVLLVLALIGFVLTLIAAYYAFGAPAAEVSGDSVQDRLAGCTRPTRSPAPWCAVESVSRSLRSGDDGGAGLPEKNFIRL